MQPRSRRLDDNHILNRLHRRKRTIPALYMALEREGGDTYSLKLLGRQLPVVRECALE